MVNTKRQLLFETQKKKEGTNILIKGLSSFNKKLPEQDVNLLFQRYKIRCKVMFFKPIMNLCDTLLFNLVFFLFYFISRFYSSLCLLFNVV